MSRKNHPDNEWLRERLRAWDPAQDGSELDGQDRARMRRRVLAAVSEPVRLGLPGRALATAAGVVLTVAVGWGIYDGAVMAPPGTPFTGPTEEAERKSRQIQFSTPGGTRVVWTLDPDFEV
jgi:hypothetical protein